MISNQYQSTQNFQGNLLKKGIILPKEKFEEAAKNYAQRTIGKPDLILEGSIAIDEVGQLYNATNIIINNKKVARICTEALQSMFEKVSPKRFVDELINLSRRVDEKDRANILQREINDTKNRMYGVKKRMMHTQNPKSTRRLQTIIDRMNASIANKEKKHAGIEPGKISKEWSI